MCRTSNTLPTSTSCIPIPQQINASTSENNQAASAPGGGVNSPPGSRNDTTVHSHRNYQTIPRINTSAKSHDTRPNSPSPTAEDTSRQSPTDTWSIGPLHRADQELDKGKKTATPSQLTSWVYETSDRKLVLSEMLEKAKWERYDGGSSSNET